MRALLIPLLLLCFGCDADPVGAPLGVAAVAVSPRVVPSKAKSKGQRANSKKRRGGRTAPLSKNVGGQKTTAPAAPPPAAPAPCPEGMAMVQGEHCRSVDQPCLEYVHDAKRGPDKTRCARFGPSRCTDPKPRRQMRFCMDVYEYPNERGELPMTLVSWTEASRLCEVQSKRLCTESEFTFACEGEAMQPYAIGFSRSAEKCNIDKSYVTPQRHLKSAPMCDLDPACAAEMKRVDGRRAIGHSDACSSPFGVIDMNGNANEWVSRPWKESPHRAAIKGGWWGPVRNRCRAITTAHDETYHGYEVGFRCCKDAAAAAVKRP